MSKDQRRFEKRDARRLAKQLGVPYLQALALVQRGQRPAAAEPLSAPTRQGALELGRGADTVPVYLDVSVDSFSPHLMIAGLTGAGKRRLVERCVTGWISSSPEQHGAWIIEQQQQPEQSIPVDSDTQIALAEESSLRINPFDMTMISPGSAELKAKIAGIVDLLQVVLGEPHTPLRRALLSGAVSDAYKQLPDTEFDRMYREPDAAPLLRDVAAILGSIQWAPDAIPGLVEGVRGLQERLAPYHGEGQYAWLWDQPSTASQTQARGRTSYLLDAVPADLRSGATALLLRHLSEARQRLSEQHRVLLVVHEADDALAVDEAALQTLDWFLRTSRKYCVPVITTISGRQLKGRSWGGLFSNSNVVLLRQSLDSLHGVQSWVNMHETMARELLRAEPGTGFLLRHDEEVAIDFRGK